MKRVLAMVLAGGRGTRMGVLCSNRPKPLLPVAGRFHPIDFVLSNCVHSGIVDIAVLTDYQRYRMATYLESWCAANAKDRNICVLEPQSGCYSGTADAVYRNIDYIEKCRATKIIVLAADHIYRMDYGQMLASHEIVGADVTVGVVRVPIGEAHHFGMVTTSNGGRITAFVEKPRVIQSNLASMGIYIFNKEVLVGSLREDAAKLSSRHDFGQDIIPTAVDRNDVFAYRFGEYWKDMGTPEAYFEANMDLARQMCSFCEDNRWPILTADSELALPKISENAVVTTTQSIPQSIPVVV